MFLKTLLACLLALFMLLVLSCASDDETEEEVVVEPEPEEVVVDEPEPEEVIDDETEEEVVDDQTNEDEEYVHTFYHTGVDPETFIDRWNSVVSEVGAGYTIDNLDATVQDLYGFGGDWAVLSVDEWLNFEVLVHPEGYVGDMYLDAVPITDAQGVDLIAMITAIIAGVTGYDADKAFDVASNDLGLEDISVDFHLELYEADNAAIRIYGDAYGWELSVEPHRR